MYAKRANSKAVNSRGRAPAPTRDQLARKREKLRRHLQNVVASSSRSGQASARKKQRGGQRSQRLSGLLTGDGGQSPSNNGRASPAPPRPVVSVRNERGTVVAVATRHPSAKSYQKAVESDFDRVSEGIANGAVYHGARFHEVETVRNGSRVMRMSGRELLGEISNVSLTTVSVGTGSRFGVFPVAPEWLGGRPKYFSDTFQQHKAMRMRVVYEPTCPTTTEGSVIIYFNNDVALPTHSTGVDEIRHAATHRDFLETPIWQCADLEIEPSQALKKYFDEGSGDARLQVQGEIVVEAGSVVAFQQAETLGHIYLEYDFEFFTPALDYSVPANPSFQASVTADFISSAVIDYAFVVSPSPAAAAAATYGSVSFVLGGGVQQAELPGYVASCTTQPNASSYSAAWTSSTLHTFENYDNEFSFVPGQTFWARFMIANTGALSGSVLMYLFADLEAASTAVLGTSISNMEDSGALRWSTTTVPNDATVIAFNGYLSKLRE